MICLVAGPALGAEHRFDGIYTGKRLLISGARSTCPTTENVSITIDGNALAFTNSALKKFTIAVFPSRNGSFGETYADEGGDTVKIRGRVIGDVLDGDVTDYGTDAPCGHHWHLKKKGTS
jgi:hypothetical protein